MMVTATAPTIAAVASEATTTVTPGSSKDAPIPRKSIPVPSNKRPAPKAIPIPFKRIKNGHTYEIKRHYMGPLSIPALDIAIDGIVETRTLDAFATKFPYFVAEYALKNRLRKVLNYLWKEGYFRTVSQFLSMCYVLTACVRDPYPDTDGH
jgi:hypothetical protein